MTKEKKKKKTKSSENSEIEEGFSPAQDKLRSIQKKSSVVGLVRFSICRFQDI